VRKPAQNAAASNSAMGCLALLAGNTLVVKVPRSTPTVVMFVYREIFQPVLARHGAPPGTLNLYAASKKPILELSGNDGFLVWRDADLDRAAQTLTGARMSARPPPTSRALTGSG
jgi:acyl-CoA reductase-like NAD-dependent aldehyde dehydrogenase